MSSGPYVAGIDLGTTTCRCIIVDLDGHVVGTARREITANYPRPLWAEIDPETWWCATAGVVREAIAMSGVRPEQIAGVGASGLMHAPVLLDSAGRPTIAAMLWLDQRCQSQAARLQLGTSQTAAKLLWLAECQPEVLAQSECLLLPKDFVRYRLTGVGGTDASDAFGTGLYDRRGRTWIWELVDAVCVPRRLLPHVSAPETLAGGVTPEAASATGLCPGTPVAMGGGDGLCTRLGAGPLAPEEVCLYLGTAAWFVQAGRAPAEILSYGATATTGAALRWLRDALVPTRPGTSVVYEDLVEAAERASAGAEGLFFLPHLMGERGPAEDPLARGALIGFTLRHGHEHLARAVLEGTVFQLRRVLDGSGAPVAPVSGVASGGVAHSRAWMQLIADITRLSLRVPEVVESGAIGAAMLGAAAAGLLPLHVAEKRMTHPGPTYTPDLVRANEYDPIYARYCELDDLLAPWFRGELSR